MFTHTSAHIHAFGTQLLQEPRTKDLTLAVQNG